MSPLPPYRPQQLSLGPLEHELMALIWQWGEATARQLHEHILQDPERELAIATITTVLQRLRKKGWLSCDQHRRAHCWRPLISVSEAVQLRSHAQLQQFLAIGNPDVVAAFADSLDVASIEQLDAILARIKAVRDAQ